MRMIYGRLLLLLVILILLLILMYFDTSDSFSQSSVSNEIYERRTRKPKIPRNNTAPIIFSKLQYLNQTRKVKLFSFCLSLLYYCIYYSQMRMLFVS
jgi:hypothetical protein